MAHDTSVQKVSAEAAPLGGRVTNLADRGG